MAGLVGCEGKSDEAPADEATPAEDDEEPETQTAEVGDPVIYECNDGGNIIITAEGFERSQTMTDEFRSYGQVDDGYSVALLLLMIENESESGFEEYGTLARAWLEDADGVTLNPLSSGLDYGEYKSAPGFAFAVALGQTIRIAVPYQVPDGDTEFNLVIDETDVSLTLTEGDRSIG